MSNPWDFPELDDLPPPPGPPGKVDVPPSPKVVAAPPMAMDASLDDLPGLDIPASRPQVVAAPLLSDEQRQVLDKAKQHAAATGVKAAKKGRAFTEYLAERVKVNAYWLLAEYEMAKLRRAERKKQQESQAKMAPRRRESFQRGDWMGVETVVDHQEAPMPRAAWFKPPRTRTWLGALLLIVAVVLGVQAWSAWKASDSSAVSTPAVVDEAPARQESLEQALLPVAPEMADGNQDTDAVVLAPMAIPAVRVDEVPVALDSPVVWTPRTMRSPGVVPDLPEEQAVETVAAAPKPTKAVPAVVSPPRARAPKKAAPALSEEDRLIEEQMKKLDGWGKPTPPPSDHND